MVRKELHRFPCGARLHQSAKGAIRLALEREDMRAGVPGDDEARRAHRFDQSSRGDRRVLDVVDEQVIQRGPRRPGGLRGPREEAGEVDDPLRGEPVQIPAVEECELAPWVELRRLGSLEELLGRKHRLLGTQDELPDLVGESTHVQHRGVDRPVGATLARQHAGDARELLGGGEHGRRLVVTQSPVAQAHHVEREPVHGERPHDGEGRAEPLEEDVPSPLLRLARGDDERHLFRIRTAFDQPGEPLAEHGGLPRPGRTGDEHDAALVSEDPCLQGVGLEGHRPHGTTRH